MEQVRENGGGRNPSHARSRTGETQQVSGILEMVSNVGSGGGSTEW